MKKILLGILLATVLTSCSGVVEPVIEEKIILNEEFASEKNFDKNISDDRQFHVSSSLGLPNYAYIDNCNYSGEDSISNIIDWSIDTNIFIKTNDTLTVNLKNEEHIRSIEVMNDSIKTIQFEFSNGLIRIFDLKDSQEIQSIEFDTPMLSKSLKVKVIKGYSDDESGALSELHIISDLKLNKKEFTKHNKAKNIRNKIQKNFDWSNDIEANKEIMKELISEFGVESIIELSEEVDPFILQSKLKKFIGYPLIIKGKVVEITENNGSYNNASYDILVKSLLDQEEYIITYDCKVEENSLVNIHGVVLGRDKDNRITIYGVK